MRRSLIAVIVTVLALVTDARAQGTGSGLGKVNPFSPQFKKDPITGQLTPTQPFTSDPNHLNNAYPTLPWAFYNPNVGGWDYGAVVQYIPVPPQPVVIQVPVVLADGEPLQIRQETVEIPGYYVAETTTGYWYPERWTLEQRGAGVYQWVRVPGEFQRKAIVERRPPAVLP
jgi:hypothetical protein